MKAKFQEYVAFVSANKLKVLVIVVVALVIGSFL